MNSEWVRTTAGVRQGCLLSPTLFNIFLERIMADALEDHEGSISISGRTITNLRFADGSEALARKEEELVKLANRLDKASTALCHGDQMFYTTLVKVILIPRKRNILLTA